MSHVEISEIWRLIFDLTLAITQTEPEKSDLIAIALAALTFQMTRVIPPLDFEIRVGVVIGREGKPASRQGKLIRKGPLTLPSPWQEEGQNQGKQRKPQGDRKERF
jgi:hypothetical protein